MNLRDQLRHQQWLTKNRDTFGRHYAVVEPDLNMLAANVSQSNFRNATSCLLNSIVSAAAKNPALWCKTYIRSILEVGFKIYEGTVNLHYRGDLQTLLEPEAVDDLKVVAIGTRVVEIEIGFWSFSGNELIPREDSEEDRYCISVEQALSRMFKTYDRGLVFIDQMWLSVARVGSTSNDVFYLFNSHGVDQFGNFGLGKVARAFHSTKLSKIAEVAVRTATKGWNGEFAVNGVGVKVRQE